MSTRLACRWRRRWSPERCGFSSGLTISRKRSRCWQPIRCPSTSSTGGTMDDAGSALRTVALFVVLLAAACGGYDDSGPASPDGRVTSLAIAEIPILRVGQTAQLVLTATMAGGRTQTVTDAAAWQSSATNVAAVSPRGLVTAVSVGISTVTA